MKQRSIIVLQLLTAALSVVLASPVAIADNGDNERGRGCELPTKPLVIGHRGARLPAQSERPDPDGHLAGEGCDRIGQVAH